LAVHFANCCKIRVVCFFIINLFNHFCYFLYVFFSFSW
jgi:hypothetical protein